MKQDTNNDDEHPASPAPSHGENRREGGKEGRVMRKFESYFFQFELSENDHYGLFSVWER